MEIVRTELPVKAGHRGRKPCEWRVDGFLVPKSLTCKECERPKATTKDAFVRLLEKSNLKPEKLVKKYICRSCRASMRDNDETVKVGKLDESKPVEKKFDVFETNKRNNTGIEFGLIVKRKPVIFHALRSDFENGPTNILSNWATAQATEVYELTSGMCLKHCNEVTDRVVRDGLRKFHDAKTTFNLDDIDAVVAKMMNGEL